MVHNSGLIHYLDQNGVFGTKKKNFSVQVRNERPNPSEETRLCVWFWVKKSDWYHRWFWSYRADCLTARDRVHHLGVCQLSEVANFDIAICLGTGQQVAGQRGSHQVLISAHGEMHGELFCTQGGGCAFRWVFFCPPPQDELRRLQNELLKRDALLRAQQEELLKVTTLQIEARKFRIFSYYTNVRFYEMPAK